MVLLVRFPPLQIAPSVLRIGFGIGSTIFFEEAALMMKLPKRHATPWEGGRLAPITIVISRG
jgi:hypothetical protein